jgi:hypothetical protein
MNGTTPSADSWFGNKVIPTGAQLLWSLSYCAAIAVALLPVGTGAFRDDRANFRNQREDVAVSQHYQAYGYVRTPAENIERIRRVFSPSVSDLAKAFDVSRQAVYNWLGGDQPSSMHLGRLRALALAADILAETTVPPKASLLRRKIIGGKNLMEIAQNDGQVEEAAKLLRNILQQETRQREELRLRFAGRKIAVPSADSDLIAENDPV